MMMVVVAVHCLSSSTILHEVVAGVFQVVGGDPEGVHRLAPPIAHLHQHLQVIFIWSKGRTGGSVEVFDIDLVVFALIIVDQVVHSPIKVVLVVLQCHLRSILRKAHLNKTFEVVRSWLSMGSPFSVAWAPKLRPPIEPHRSLPVPLIHCRPFRSPSDLLNDVDKLRKLFHPVDLSFHHTGPVVGCLMLPRLHLYHLLGPSHLCYQLRTRLLIILHLRHQEIWLWSKGLFLDVLLVHRVVPPDEI
mmetsp:Transcript_27082/g.26144  ORF Transcript_27082/g.26144 Transcript_27082/m.26144 type:complete len:245 (-) Transcript_27082:399-1133(-)